MYVLKEQNRVQNIRGHIWSTDFNKMPREQNGENNLFLKWFLSN